MPANKPTINDILNEKISFVSLDTEVMKAVGFQFSKGALNQLPHQLPKSIRLLFTQVVAEEVKKHRLQPVLKAIEQLEGSLHTINRITGIDIQLVQQAAAGLDIAQTAGKYFDTELHSYAARGNGRVLPWDGLDAMALFKQYFARTPPFEDGKKSEFPDAATLQQLERYADQNNTFGIVISGDAGLEKYAATSPWIYYFATLDELTALFVATGKSVQEIESRVKQNLAQPDSVLHEAIARAISDHVSHAEWDASGFVPSLGDRMDMTVYEAVVQDFTLSDSLEFWHEKDQEDAWVVELTANVEVDLAAAAEVYKRDSIDRDEVRIASQPVELQETVDVSIYITLGEVDLGTPLEDWDIEVDIASASYHLGSSEIELDLW